MENENKLSDIRYDDIQQYTISDFIDVGGDSIVFKGIKNSVRRTYALKFRPMSKFEDFFEYELKTLSSLEQCSTSKLAGIILEIPFELQKLLYNKIPQVKREFCEELQDSSVEYFCIVEDYISGCNLEEYCRGSSIKKIISHTPSLDATYDQVVDFQKKLLNWTKQFCEIMIHVTENSGVLHLDIKPANIMISNETESLVVIDFGKSLKINSRASSISLTEVYGNGEFVYGTNLFAPPECCHTRDMVSALNIQLADAVNGIVDARSDIFSFGALLWDCVNPQPNIHIRVTEQGYFKRDLFNTPKGYIPEFEDIIVKCTEKDPNDRYQSYEELRKAVDYAEKKLLQRDKPSKTLFISCVLAIFFVVMILASFAINSRRSNLTFEIAKNNFDVMASEYTDHSVSEYKELAIELVKADPGRKDSYESVLEVACQDESVSSEELSVLLECLKETDDSSIVVDYVNKVMQNPYDKEIKSISESISINTVTKEAECDGLVIANAIYNYNSDTVESYDTLIEYQNKTEYETALRYLNKMIFNDSRLTDQIATEKEIDKDDLENPFGS